MRQYGYENTSIQQICEEAQVSTGTFYHLFPSKHDLFTHVVSAITQAHNQSHTPLDFEKDSPYVLATSYSRGLMHIIHSLSPEVVFGVFFLTPGGNKLFYSEEHPSRRFLLSALTGFQQAGKLRADIPVKQMCNELFSSHLGMMYSAYTTGTMDTLQEDLEVLLKRLIGAYMTASEG